MIEFLKSLREKHKLSQKQMAEKLNIDQSHYSRIERGEYEVNIFTIHYLHKNFDVSYEEIYKKLLKKTKGVTTKEIKKCLTKNSKKKSKTSKKASKKKSKGTKLSA